MKNYPKQCIDCGNAAYEILSVDYPQRDAEGNEIIVSSVEILRCPNCGEELVPAASSKKIGAAVAEANEQLKPEHLYNMMESFETDSQKELAEICGFGEKTFHRWLKGTQTVSRSMGYYLRVLTQFPEAFLYVKERAWRNGPAPQAESSEESASETVSQFPALERRGFDRFYEREDPTQLFAQSSH